ncbi:MAG TPA: transcription antitermination factor NusB [Limnochordia bacterium]
MSRRAARATALKALFQIDVGRADPEDALAFGAEGESLSEEDALFAAALVHGTLAHLEALDAEIGRLAIGWAVERLGRVDRNLLRLSLYELYYARSAPPEVVVSEAVVLAKRYGDTASARFVNGILGTALKRMPNDAGT